MQKPRTLVAMHAVGALVAGGLGFVQAVNLSEMEAGSGQLTGPLIYLSMIGGLALLVCSILMLIGRAIVILVALTATFLCLPLSIYRIAPSSLSWLAEAPSSVTSSYTVSFDPAAVVEIIALLFVAAMCAGRRMIHR